MDKMQELAEIIRKFVSERDWEQFHSPKNLSMALSAETAEIMEIFQWMTEEQSFKLEDKKLEHLKQEIGDVMIYLLNLSAKFNIDPVQAAMNKMEINRVKYPMEKVRGSSKKYNEYD